MRSVFFIILFGISIFANAHMSEIYHERGPRIFTSYGAYYFKMMPADYHYEGMKTVIDKEVHGIAYKLEHDGTETELWRVNGWYASELYLSSDGKYLVRIGHPSECIPPEEDFFMAFYKNGIEIKRYFLKDFIKNTVVSEKCSWGSYMSWLERKDCRPRLVGNRFEMTTTEGKLYLFNIETGDIIRY